MKFDICHFRTRARMIYVKIIKSNILKSISKIFLKSVSKIKSIIIIINNL